MLNSDLSGKQQVYISSGLGGHNKKLRFFSLFTTPHREDLSDLQKQILEREFRFQLETSEVEIEKFEIKSNYFSILMLFPFDIDVKAMKSIKIVALIIFFQLSLQVQLANAKDIPFVPPVFNYNTSNYNAGNQNWAISQDHNGLMYFANNQGLICFDGVNWTLHKLPNNLGVKSIFIDEANELNGNNERIYIGSFEEFGYFERDITNRLNYKSLKHLVKDYTFRNDEIWTILKHNNIVYFQSFSSYFSYNGNSITAHNTNPAPLFFFNLQNTLFGQLIKDGLFQLNGNKYDRIIARSQLADDDVVGMVSNGDDFILITSKSGAFRYNTIDKTVHQWNTSIDSELSEAVVNRVVSLSDRLFVLGTINNGLYAINNSGKLSIMEYPMFS